VILTDGYKGKKVIDNIIDGILTVKQCNEIAVATNGGLYGSFREWLSSSPHKNKVKIISKEKENDLTEVFNTIKQLHWEKNHILVLRDYSFKGINEFYQRHVQSGKLITVAIKKPKILQKTDVFKEKKKISKRIALSLYVFNCSFTRVLEDYIWRQNRGLKESHEKLTEYATGEQSELEKEVGVYE